MTANQLVPAAQYLRKSPEHQQYSLENQSTAIQRYADSQGFEVVRTYSDAAKSGLVLRHRIGLRQLLQDVVSGSPDYRVILVYDVSRWGRFQDTDESAHYEFLCKSAGVPVHYCAETFANDGTLPSLIMKALKRTMAGEYSRELGVKVLAGQKRLALLGFKQGGMPGYGLRRMLVSERRSVYALARELNRRGVAYIGGSEWHYQAVYNVLTHPKYAGCHAFGRTSSRLYTPTVKLPKSEWILKHGAFEPIIDAATFAEAQTILEERTFNKTDEDLLDGLRGLLASERRLSLTLIQNSANLPSPSTYRNRFGSLRRAYELIGYGHPDQFGPLEMRRRTQALREELIAKIVSTLPNEISIVRRGGRWRSRLRLPRGLIVSVLVARSVRTWKETLRWLIDPVRRESKCITLLARLDSSNRSFLDLHIFPYIDRQTRFLISLRDAWLNRGKRLSELSRLCEVVARVHSARKSGPRKSHQRT